MILLALLLALPAFPAFPAFPAQAAEPALKPGTIDRFLSAITEPLDRNQRILLATHLPKLFRFHFLCQFRPPQGNPVAFVPGEWLDAPEGGTLFCPDHYEFTLAKQTRLRLIQIGSSPSLFLERGMATVTFGRDLLYFSTATFDLNLGGLGSGQRVSFSPDGVDCSLGSITADLDTFGADIPKQVFSAHSCRIELGMNGGAIKRYLLSDDKVQAANLALPRRFWPKLGQPNLGATSPDQLAIVLSIAPGQLPGAAFRAQWMIPGTLPVGASCEVFAQSSDAQAAVKVTAFKTQASTGELLLDPSYRATALSMVCEDDKRAMASNVVLQADPSLPGM